MAIKNVQLRAAASLILPAFLIWIKDRREAGETLEAIGISLGVSHAAVTDWISGRRVPSLPVLLLGNHLMRETGSWPML